MPWRFLDAGQLSLPSVSSLPASKKQNKTRSDYAHSISSSAQAAATGKVRLAPRQILSTSCDVVACRASHFQKPIGLFGEQNDKVTWFQDHLWRRRDDSIRYVWCSCRSDGSLFSLAGDDVLEERLIARAVLITNLRGALAELL